MIQQKSKEVVYATGATPHICHIPDPNSNDNVAALCGAKANNWQTCTLESFMRRRNPKMCDRCAARTDKESADRARVG